MYIDVANDTAYNDSRGKSISLTRGKIMLVSPLRPPMTDTSRKRIRLSQAAAMLDLDIAYLSRLIKAGTLEREAVTVLRPYPDVVEFYEDEIIAWHTDYHLKRARKKRP
jgi:hypothetical protein